MSGETHCPFCASTALSGYHQDKRRAYLQCDNCALVFVPTRYHLSADAERAEYDLHENHVQDPSYRAFLSRLMAPLLDRLEVGAKGLDFGCGPGPALASMLEEAGFEVALYDPFYFPDPAVLEQHYNFICATEVIEHLREPGKEIGHLWEKLLPGGRLAIMTKLVRDQVAFAAWHYKNDPTHICFFSIETWNWWANRNRAFVEFVGADVIFLQRLS